ncbi:MAG: Uma2 family endonuclease [Chloroflexota bacterium]|nr:Uma2 family endonuclease [Chloroflexota bacterium]
MVLSQQTYERVALEDPDGQWELHHGRLREKPPMTWEHNDAMVLLGHFLLQQLDRRQFRVRINAGRVRRSSQNVYIPDVLVVPTSYGDRLRDRSDLLEVFDDPLPLVVEIWSPSTGDYDVDAKIPEYQRRGDAEIWHIHPYERTLTAWRRQPDGSYKEATFHGGAVQPVALPHVSIDLDALFE